MAAGAGAATPAQRENFVDTGVPENLHERKSGLCANNLFCSIAALDTYLAQIATPKAISITICPHALQFFTRMALGRQSEESRAQ